MNIKKHLWNRLLTALLIAALLLVPTVPALATDGEPSPDGVEINTPTTEPPATSHGDDAEPDSTPDDAQDGQETDTTPPPDDGEDNTTPEPETPPESPETGLVTVSTLEELLQAIDQAEAGATIGVECEIVCPNGTVLGSPDYAVTIKRTAPEGHVYFIGDYSTETATIQNITFDGAEIESYSSFVGSSVASTFVNCNFINCYGGFDGALTFWSGDNTLNGCTFENNINEQGGHLRIDGNSAIIRNCSFTNGSATMKGGAILNCSIEEVILENCLITGNTSAQHGGGIWNSGVLTIEGCKIYGNTSNGEPDDIVNEYYGRLALMDDHNALVALYESDGLIPNKWTVDTFTRNSFGPRDYPNMIFTMTFATNEPTPDPVPTPEPEPVPDPTPEPTPDPDPTPTPKPTPEPDPTPTPDPIPDPTPEPTPDPTPTPDHEPEPTPDPEPDPTPTPSPEPVEPTPVPDPVPVISPRPSHSGSPTSRPTVTPVVDEEQPKAPATLTNGKAVLIAPEALYWAGYNDSRGGGAGTITRADLALLMLSMMDQPSREKLYISTAAFTDVEPGSWSAPAIGTVSRAGIMVGCGNNLFCPDRLLTWGELITVFSRFTTQGSPPAVYTGEHWARDAINTAISLGWISYTEAFDPGATVTCGEMVDFIQTVFQWALE